MINDLYESTGTGWGIAQYASTQDRVATSPSAAVRNFIPIAVCLKSIQPSKDMKATANPSPSEGHQPVPDAPPRPRSQR